MKVMLGGSLKIGHLTEAIERLVKEAIAEGHHFEIGDAPGADALFQKLLKSEGSSLVTIFYAGPKARFNLGGWTQVQVESGLKSNSHRMHGAKDRQMVKNCDKGLFAWDGKSVGTVTNALEFLEQGKPFTLVLQSQLERHQISDFDTLNSFFPDVLLDASKRLAAARRRAEKISRETQKTSDKPLF